MFEIRRSQTNAPNRHAYLLWAASYGGAKNRVGDEAASLVLKASFAAIGRERCVCHHQTPRRRSRPLYSELANA